MRMLKNLIVFIVLAGVAVAILRIFGYDPFVAIEWFTGLIWTVIDGIANWLNTTWFRDFFEG